MMGKPKHATGQASERAAALARYWQEQLAKEAEAALSDLRKVYAEFCEEQNREGREASP